MKGKDSSQRQKGLKFIWINKCNIKFKTDLSDLIINYIGFNNKHEFSHILSLQKEKSSPIMQITIKPDPWITKHSNRNRPQEPRENRSRIFPWVQGLHHGHRRRRLCWQERTDQLHVRQIINRQWGRYLLDMENGRDRRISGSAASSLLH